MPETDARFFVTAIAKRYGSRLRRFLSTRLRNSQDVPDLAQEVFLRLLRVDQHESIRSPEAYLFTVARHVLHQHASRVSVDRSTVDIAEVVAELHALAGDEPTAKAESAEAIASLERMLKDLPPRVGTALIMHKVFGYTVQEIGDEFGVSRETAKKYLARAAEHCRNVSVGKEYGDSHE
ncbi:RNA polymerase sigma factor [Peristeroidobacter soli]|uniref:RNA polymerase sigma factor n=1 Tax=Peristeroidobacter soli TaxID=2497877 RepID=UPI001300AC53|nr:RNA polymerase sigma factor [Peristeroidobacter soli]